jgi:hypothetical protein
MRKILTNNPLMLSTAGFLAMVGIVVSLWRSDFSWFARFGSVITGIGMVILTRPSIIGKDILLHIGMAETGLSQLDREHYRRVGEPIPDWLIEDEKSRKAVGVFGPVVTLIGTLVWGFADLLNIPFGYAH